MRSGLSPKTLLALVDVVATAPEQWSHLVVHDPQERLCVRLIATDLYEIWLLGWTPGQSVDLHDHGPSHAAFRVVEGQLTEVKPGLLGLRRQTLVAGSRRRLASGTVHDVLNDSPAPATSIHAYSPPLSVMTFYDRTASMKLRSEPVNSEAPVFAGLAPPAATAATTRSLTRR